MTQTAKSLVLPPVRADGLAIRNRLGVVIATVTTPTISRALVYLINSGDVWGKDLEIADPKGGQG